MQPWTDSEVTNEVPSSTTTTALDGSGTEHYRVELAFEWSEDKSIILDQLDQYAAAYCDWHRLGYHVCDHDESDRSGCSWDEIRENGTVPSNIPTL